MKSIHFAKRHLRNVVRVDRAVLMVLSVMMVLACQESLEKRCAREARKYTEKNCPARIDEYTIIDSMAFDMASHTLHYYYRFTGMADRDGLEKEQLRLTLLDALKNSTSLRAYKNAGYVFVYTYRSDSDPSLVRFETTFTDKDYQ